MHAPSINTSFRSLRFLAFLSSFPFSFSLLCSLKLSHYPPFICTKIFAFGYKASPNPPTNSSTFSIVFVPSPINRATHTSACVIPCVAAYSLSRAAPLVTNACDFSRCGCVLVNCESARMDWCAARNASVLSAGFA